MKSGRSYIGKRQFSLHLCAPIAMLGTGGEPHPSMSKVEGSVIKRPDGGWDPRNGPYVPPQPEAKFSAGVKW